VSGAMAGWTVAVGPRRLASIALLAMATLRLFAAARVAAGIGRDEVEGAHVDEVMDAARARYGVEFAAVVARCRIWVNGEPAEAATPVGPDDEVAVLPPVSGG
jgi:molybdopterin synthase sulfur carrier subunit